MGTFARKLLKPLKTDNLWNKYFIRITKRLFCTKNSEYSREIPKCDSFSKQGEDQIKTKILDSSLPFVPVHGWSRNAITAGAQSLDYPGITHGLFPRGGIELVEHFYKKSNASLLNSLSSKISDEDAKRLLQMADEDKKIEMKNLMTEAVQERLRMIIPYIEKWPEALTLMTLPQNIPTALANLLTLVDDICYYAGDRSVTMTWYARRVALAGIYKATELYMLTDNSEDYKQTWVFLNRRMEEAAQMQRYITQTEQASQFAKEFATATFTTARNILGLNWNR